MKAQLHLLLLLAVLVVAIFPAAAAETDSAKAKPRKPDQKAAAKGYDAAVPKPTFSEVRYGSHARNVLDFWKAESSRPTPLVFVIHGGGALWVSDDGLKFNPAWTQVAYDRIPAYDHDYDPQRVVKIYGSHPKLERPKVLMQEGQPAWLYAPSGLNVTGGGRTAIYLLRINLKPGDGPLPSPVRVAL